MRRRIPTAKVLIRRLRPTAAAGDSTVSGDTSTVDGRWGNYVHGGRHDHGHDGGDRHAPGQQRRQPRRVHGWVFHLRDPAGFWRRVPRDALQLPPQPDVRGHGRLGHDRQRQRQHGRRDVPARGPSRHLPRRHRLRPRGHARTREQRRQPHDDLVERSVHVLDGGGDRRDLRRDDRDSAGLARPGMHGHQRNGHDDGHERHQRGGQLRDDGVHGRPQHHRSLGNHRPRRQRDRHVHRDDERHVRLRHARPKRLALRGHGSDTTGGPDVHGHRKLGHPHQRQRWS